MRNRLRAERLGQGVTIADLARRSDVSRQTIYSIENDLSYTPLGAVMGRLARALGVEIGDLFINEPAEADRVEAAS